MIMTLIAVVIGGFMLAYVYIEHDREEIQKKQAELEKKINALAKNVYSHPDFKDVEV